MLLNTFKGIILYLELYISYNTGRILRENKVGKMTYTGIKCVWRWSRHGHTLQLHATFVFIILINYTGIRHTRNFCKLT